MLAALLATRPSTIVITTSFLPNGVQDVPYTFTLLVTGGTAPYTWVTISGTLPEGLTLSATGVISGIPTSRGISHFVVRVADASLLSATVALTLTILIYGNQFVAATTTFPCIAFAKQAAVLTTNPAITQQLLFYSSSHESIVDSLDRIYAHLISQRAADDPSYLSLTIFQAIGVLGELNGLIQSLSVTSVNLFILADIQQRMQFALNVMQGLLLLPD